MNPEYSPKRKLEYINETILNTPQPQASSTVERKGVLRLVIIIIHCQILIFGAYHVSNINKTGVCRINEYSVLIFKKIRVHNYITVYSFSHRFHSGKPEANKFKNDTKKKTKELLDDVPTRDTDTMSVKSNSSRVSSSSSLGILSLENMDDFQDYLNNVTKNSSLVNDMKSTEVNVNVNEKLQMQRVLAQKALERADAKTNTGGLPSYLLKPSDTPGIITLLNLSDVLS